MTKCNLCSDEAAMLYTVEGPEGKEYRLCEDCLEMTHEAYVEIK